MQYLYVGGLLASLLLVSCGQNKEAAAPAAGQEIKSEIVSSANNFNSSAGAENSTELQASTPEKAINTIFRLAKAGNINQIKQLISSGYLDNYDANEIRSLFGRDDVAGIEVSTLAEANQRSEVSLVLITPNGRLVSNQNVLLVWQDGMWKLDYSGLSWPGSLKISSYSMQ